MVKKKRKKSSRMRGSHTHGRGFKKKARGSGHRGGFGMAGTGKRADHKKTLILNLPKPYFGKKGMNPKEKNYDVINLDEISEIINEKKEINLENKKVLGRGEIKSPVKIIAYSASKSAIEKVKKAGGEIIIKRKEEE
ncbi:MAG: uL15 family ribosomal protein [Candidatus Pacearchaeota archaeon]